MKLSGQTAAGQCCLWLAMICLPLAGCRTPVARLPPLPANTIKPVVAVSLFENETGFAGQWKLGRGIPDLLVAELLATGYVVVVDRQNLNAVMSEIMRQGHDLFRKENGVARGRLKNTRYLVRGVITDFTQTGSASGWFRTAQVSGGMRGARALVMVNITLTDIETGEILKSISADGTARASGYWAKFDYRDVAFGGEAFF
ncbi:MAG: CsgG/HfaB family protein, partial [Kiritimatiellia bacterium]